LNTTRNQMTIRRHRAKKRRPAHITGHWAHGLHSVNSPKRKRDQTATNPAGKIGKQTCPKGTFTRSTNPSITHNRTETGQISTRSPKRDTNPTESPHRNTGTL
ncbi:MAG: hypothetical protein OXF84_04995, partial [Bacteroidetes bacterium]|nr:hypothetical protein [Bacteroidota bacterium]